ncbi:MAG: DUF3332 domain-containing protein [Muribaculaceae bacterium]|nr:DUF3332 domain-containing protein [Muribaculaceae bacterium]
MRKSFITAAIVCTLGASMTLSSCIGSFTLTNKLISWNKTVGNKFVNELVFFAFWVLPVYEVSSLADLIVLNSIEFWSGVNPVASGTKVIEGNDGKYLVKSDKKGYTITSENDGTTVRLEYSAEKDGWQVTVPDGSTYTIFTFVDDTHIALPAADGSTSIVELSEAGLMAYRAQTESMMLAVR